jgi:uncharacterized protein (DUF1501 family)
MTVMMLRRRTALIGFGSVLAFGGASLAVAQAATRQRFVAIILRGALDGLSVVVPYGDPNLKVWRAPLLPPEPGRDRGVLDLGGFWGLHPAMANLHTLYGSGEALLVHAVAGPNHSRSHFEAQDILECGAEHRMETGWLNRLAGLLPSEKAADTAVSLSLNLPLMLQGPTPVSSWSRDNRPKPAGDFYASLLELHANDPLTKAALVDGLRERGFDAQVLNGTANTPSDAPFVTLAKTGGKLLSDPNGPRLAMLELGGWDTHTAQLPRLKTALGQLDAGIAALKEGLGPAWKDTVVFVMTEFGRTVRVNGTHGTDHGTGTIAFVIGGNVAGGRVQADWPGLAEAQLYEDRDLRPTLDIRGVAKGIIGPHFNLSPKAMEAVFPDSAAATPLARTLKA